MGLSIFSLKKFLIQHPRSFISLDLGNGLKKYMNFEEIQRDMNFSYSNDFFSPLLLAIDQDFKNNKKRTKKQSNYNAPPKKYKNSEESNIK